MNNLNLQNIRNKNSELSPEQNDELISTLKIRFEKNTNRHKTIDWAAVELKLQANPGKLWTLHEMEKTGGEPDIVHYDKKSLEYIFYDFSAESPAGRRSLCFDRAAMESRKENKPLNNVMDVAAMIGIELLTELEYRYLQTLGKFDIKTSSWISTPADVITLGGALFCDRRYNTVFVYHNRAESYYAARGFRGLLKV